MIFYFSGYDAIKAGPIKDWVIYKCPSRLQSCHEVHMKSTTQWLERSRELGIGSEVDIMLDSGAFTAWNKGFHLTLDHLLPVYEDIQQKYGSMFRSMVFINLDVIPGSRKKPPTEKETADALIQSDLNYDVLRRRLGDCVLPVFHQGEHWGRFYEVAAQSNFVCVAPRQTLNEQTRVTFLHHLNSKIEERGLTNRVHGLATTGNQIIKAHDWYSVDSASWGISAVFGNILVDIDGYLKPVAVSNESPGKHTKNAHLTTLSKTEQSTIIQKLAKYELTPELVGESNACRRAFNMVSVNEWSKSIKRHKNSLNQEQELFDVF